MLGLKINLGKSKLAHVGAVTNIEELVDVLGCKWGSLPMKYLGLPFVDKFKERTIWNAILEKVEGLFAG